VAAQGSLAGMHVVDLTQGLCGPFCSMQLGDAGADVIKIEPPTGDSARGFGPPFIGTESAVFLSLNRNKRSLAIDYTNPAGCDLVRRLARTADVLVEDFGPGVASKLGLGYDDLKDGNPRLVYASISAFGDDGPLKDLPGAELTIQAMAEYAASLGKIGDPPIRLGADVASLNTGIFAAQSIFGALFYRERNGTGQHVSVNQFCSLLHLRGIMWHAMSNPDDWFGFHLDHYTNPPEYGYQAKDGPLYFILRRGTSEDWDRLLLKLGMEHVLADRRFDDFGRQATSIGRYASEVKPIWEEAFKDKTRAESIDLIHSVGGDAVPILDYPSLVAHPQVAAIDALATIDHPTAGTFQTVAPFIRFMETPLAINLPPPLLGQHSREILIEAGLSEIEIERLITGGTVTQASAIGGS
jgi:crotonobetainyl-CoA:carnitine CoA-transferase CaiB-like acyl-CoA transferase